MQTNLFVQQILSSKFQASAGGVVCLWAVLIRSLIPDFQFISCRLTSHSHTFGGTPVKNTLALNNPIINASRGFMYLASNHSGFYS